MVSINATSSVAQSIEYLDQMKKIFLRDYKLLIDKLLLEKKELILAMDQNLDFIKCGVHKTTADFLDLNLENMLYPSILCPTRITKNTATLIDNIYLSNQLARNFSSSIIISDHFPCLVQVNKIYREPLVFKTRNMTDDKYKLLLSMLQTYDWTTILRSEDPNICMGGLYKILNEGLDTIAPQVEKRISYRKRICDPWVTPALRISFTNISKLCKSVCLLDKTDPKYLEYKTKRNCLTKLKRLMRIKHYKSKLLEFRNDSKNYGVRSIRLAIEPRIKVLLLAISA